MLSLQWLCVPFILTTPATANFTAAALTNLHQEPWLGKLQLEDAGRWLDDVLLLVLITDHWYWYIIVTS